MEKIQVQMMPAMTNELRYGMNSSARNVPVNRTSLSRSTAPASDTAMMNGTKIATYRSVTLEALPEVGVSSQACVVLGAQEFDVAVEAVLGQAHGAGPEDGEELEQTENDQRRQDEQDAGQRLARCGRCVWPRWA